MSDASDISGHYTSGDLLARLEARLREDGLDPAQATPEALAPYDHFHGRGLEATEDMAGLLQAAGTDHILDVGCGLGGPARYLAGRFGCRVSGIDLTAEFCDVARHLTALLGFEDHVSISQGDALAMPFDDAMFDGAYSMNVSMNIADGALGFWKAIEEVWPRTRSQRCWVHKTANVLNKLPKSQHSKAKRALQEIWMAETRNHADSAFDAFIETYAVKYDKAAACLVKDRETMLAFYDFPAEHWKHLRTTNPIESTFATVRHRTVRSKGCLSNKTALAMVFKLAQAAQNSWRRLDGHNQLPKLIVGVKFIDGIEAVRQQPQAAA